MPLGVMLNCAAVLISGVIGSGLGRYISEQTRKYLTVLLGFCSISIGINSVIKVHAMPPIILAVILGSAAGHLCKLEKAITGAFGKLLQRLSFKRNDAFDMEQFITAAVLFCTSGFGIYGVLLEGMSGNSSMLLSKTVLDLFTGAIFAVTLGLSVSVIALPMLAIFMPLYFLAGIIAPVVSNTMLMDFMACGGILTIAAGLRVSGIKNTPISNMIADNLNLSALNRLQVFGFISPAAERKFADRQIDSLRIKCSSRRQLVKELSGGNKQKISFGKWIGNNSKILVFDSPTRGVDIGVKTTMYQLLYDLKKQGYAILIISEELPELIGMSDRICILKDGEITKTFTRSQELNDSMIIEYMI